MAPPPSATAHEGLADAPETGALGSVDDLSTRTERRRARRVRTFVDAARGIVADEGFEGLTMARLAEQLDTAVSAVYRYFPSKGALIAQIQLEAIAHLAESLGSIRRRADEHLATTGVHGAAASTARLVLVGRWFCAASESYPEEMRLLQMIMSQRASQLDEDGGERVYPVAISLVAQCVEILAEARTAGVVTDGDDVDRAVIWASALGGVLQTDDLEHYDPDRFGHTRLARQASLDLLAGWGIGATALAAASAVVDRIAADGTLAP